MAETITTGQYNTRTTGLPTITSTSILFWAFPTTVNNAYHHFVSIGPNSSTFINIAIDDNNNLATYNGSAEVAGSAVTASVWIHLALTIAGTGSGHVNVYRNGVLEITNAGNAAVTATELAIGVFPGTHGEQYIGRIANFQIYNRVLTAAEIKNQMMQYVPIGPASINGWHPWLNVETTDYSGAGNALTQTGAPTLGDGPPIPWSRGRSKIYLPAAVGGGGGPFAFRRTFSHLGTRVGSRQMVGG